MLLLKLNAAQKDSDLQVDNIKNMFENLWVEKYRPKTLQDIVLSVKDLNFFLSLKEKNEIPNLLFAGSPGTGKTSLAKIIVNHILDCQYLYINASDENGIDTIRSKVLGFSQTKSFDGAQKVVLLDEADSISLEGSKALRNVIEEYSSNTRFIFTCNYLFKIIPALQSRCQIFNLTPPLEGVIARVIYILKQENISVPDTEKSKLITLIRNSYPDLRRIINDIQKYSFTGELRIDDTSVKNIANKVIEKIKINCDPCELRRFVIEREQEFSGNFLQLLKEMFEVVFNKQQPQAEKSKALLTISEGMYKDALVTDKEINWFSTCLKLY
jgi:replication-associated recombination protein RarA